MAEAKKDEKAPETKETPKPREPKKGDKVNLVVASGDKAPAVITGVNEDGTIDLKSGKIVITNSPRDDAGRMSDSWSFAD